MGLPPRQCWNRNRPSGHRKQIDPDPKGFTDFNDLANKSELGREGVKRQVTTAVGKVLIDVGQEQKAQKLEQEQKREQKQEQRPKRAAKIG